MNYTTARLMLKIVRKHDRITSAAAITGQLAQASVTIHVEPQEAHQPHSLPP